MNFRTNVSNYSIGQARRKKFQESQRLLEKICLNSRLVLIIFFQNTNKYYIFPIYVLILLDILELDHLTVSGNVNFGKGVVLKGTVIIIANHGEQIDIPSGAILENKIVSGNLRILDH